MSDATDMSFRLECLKCALNSNYVFSNGSAITIPSAEKVVEDAKKFYEFLEEKLPVYKQ